MINIILGILVIANLLIAYTYAIDSDIAHTIVHCTVVICLMLSLTNR